jgi:hypothetical protein
MAHLDVSCAPVQIQVDVFDFTELGKRVVQIFFTSLLVECFKTAETSVTVKLCSRASLIPSTFPYLGKDGTYYNLKR